MQKALQSLYQRDEIDIVYSHYSNDILGYSIINKNTNIPTFVVNANQPHKIQKKIIKELKRASVEYYIYGFILLYHDFKLRLSPYYMYNEKTFRYEPNANNKDGTINLDIKRANSTFDKTIK